MAYCERCGKYWLVRTGAIVKRAIMSRSSIGLVDVPDLICPSCSTPADTQEET
jgi:hypothetical protein